MAEIIHLKDENFETYVAQSSVPVLVDFWAEWCAPCRAIAPTLEELAFEYNDKIVVAKVNVDHEPNTPGTYNIRGIPSLLLFVDGTVKDRKVGSSSKKDLTAWLGQHL